MATLITSKLRKAIFSIEDSMPHQILNRVSQVVGYVKIHFKADGISFEATDSSTTRLIVGVESCDNTSNIESRISISCKALMDLLDDIPDKKVTLTCEDETSLKVQYGETFRIIPGVSDDSPEWEKHDSGTFQGHFCVKKSVFRAVLDACCPYVSIGVAGEELTQINFRWDGNQMTAEATNKISFIQVNFPAVSQGQPFDFMISPQFLVKLLNQKWERLKVETYADRIIATNETGSMLVEGKTLPGSYPMLDNARRKVVANAVVSKISPIELPSVLVPVQHSHRCVTMICENQNLHVCPISHNNFKQKSFTEKGEGFAWASLGMNLLLNVCVATKNAKEFLMYVAKPNEVDVADDCSVCSDGESKLLPVLFEYTVKDCACTLGVMQLVYPEESFEFRTQQMLIDRYQPEVEEGAVEIESTEENENIFSVSVDFFPADFFDRNDDRHCSEEVSAV